jgi:hypothetical protein
MNNINIESDNEYEEEEVEEVEEVVKEEEVKPKKLTKKQEKELKPKRTRKMTPEMLQKLSLAREKAQEKRRELGKTTRSLKEQKDKEYELNKRRVLYQQEKLKKLEDELDTLKEKDPTIEEAPKKLKKKKKKEIVIEVSESEDEESEEEEVKVVKKKVVKKKPKKKPVIEEESEEDEVVIEPKHYQFERDVLREKPQFNAQLYRNLFPN